MRRLVPFLACLLAGACLTYQPTAAPAAPSAGNDARTQSEQAEAAAIAAAVSQAQSKKSDYLLSGADLLEISVFGEKDMSRQVRVSQNGTITFPLVGSVKVGGLTTAGAEAALAAGLKEYLRAPSVTIFIKEYGNKKVFVFGQVNKPGAVELPTETKMTVLEAISQAGGFTRIAAPDRSRVIRSVDGVSQSFTVEVSAITHGGQKDKDIVLEPNDVIFVPESMF